MLRHGWRPVSSTLPCGGSGDEFPFCRTPLSCSFDIQIDTKRQSIRMPNREQTKTEVLQGTLDPMVLQTVDSLGPSHGYALASRLEQVSGGALQLNMGTLYPGLMRLEQRGFVRGKWGVTENNRKARFYSLTPAGRRELETERAEWDRITSIMHALLHQLP